MKEPDYEERSKLVQDTLLSDPLYQAIRDKVYKDLIVDAPESIKTIKNLRNNSSDEHIKLKSARELLSIAGFTSNQKIEIGGTVQFQPYDTEDDNGE